jgi:Tfp pilus assembly protein PilF
VSIKSINQSIYRTITGPTNLDLAIPYYNLGLVHSKLNELADAENYFRRALEIYSKQLEPSDERIATVSQTLAGVLEETGQLGEAKMLDNQYGTCRMQK